MNVVTKFVQEMKPFILNLGPKEEQHLKYFVDGLYKFLNRLWKNNYVHAIFYYVQIFY